MQSARMGMFGSIVGGLLGGIGGGIASGGMANLGKGLTFFGKEK